VEPLTAVGCDTVAPTPFATALVVTVPDTVMAAVAPITFACGIAGTVTVAVFALYVVGEPLMLTVTTDALVRVAAAAVNPAGNPVTAKFAGVNVVAYVLFASVYTMLAPLTACPTLRPVSPVEVTAMVGGTAAVLIAALRTAVPAL